MTAPWPARALRPPTAQVAILGAGFSGSLLACALRARGMDVLLLERGRHPRFAIGESSTPLGNFKLRALADDYGLDWLRPLAKHGTWRTVYPDLPCGRKRGFSFYRQQRGQLFLPPGRDASLLVAASPDAERADTHWLRADFDAFLCRQAAAVGAEYFDECEVERLERRRGGGWQIAAKRHGEPAEFAAEFLVDCTGGGHALARALDLPAEPPAELHAASRAVFSHFVGVRRWEEVLREAGGPPAVADDPFPCDEAALHHIVDHGWMWVLRFDDGLVSAGFSLHPERRPAAAHESAEAEWQALLAEYPAIAAQFADARPVQPWTRTGRLQRRLQRAAGPDWALAPHAVGFLDAWLSPGIAQTLFGIDRLARILSQSPPGSARTQELAGYETTVRRELACLDRLAGACFATFARPDGFPVLTSLAWIYFLAAITMEERVRDGTAGPDDAFLLADDEEFQATAEELRHAAAALPPGPEAAAGFAAWSRAKLQPYDRLGLLDPALAGRIPFSKQTQLPTSAAD